MAHHRLRSIVGLAGFAVLLSGSAHAAPAIETLYSFCGTQGCPDGDQPYAGVTLESSGNLVGTTGFGGKYNGGTVFASTTNTEAGPSRISRVSARAPRPTASPIRARA